jgi:hypothetical protein
LTTESERYDHREIDSFNTEFLQSARQKRKLHRKHQSVRDLEGESDVDEDFKLGVGEAAGRFAVKRRKKHTYNEDGVEIEPFNLERDIKDGFLTNEGVFKLNREKREEEEEEFDAWFESVKDDQAKMRKEKARQEVDSD